MCILCEGADRDEALFSLHAMVITHGWALQGVEAGPSTLGWVYSVGLAQRFRHPELVVVGGDLLDGARAINELGEEVRAGRRFEPGAEVRLPIGLIGIGAVHPAHVAGGLVAVWEEYHDALGPPRPELALLQLILPGGGYCHHHNQSVPLLSDPSTDLAARPATLPNRAQRRLEERSRRAPRDGRGR